MYFLDIDKSIMKPFVGVAETQEGCLVQGYEGRLSEGVIFASSICV